MTDNPKPTNYIDLDHESLANACLNKDCEIADLKAERTKLTDKIEKLEAFIADYEEW